MSRDRRGATEWFCPFFYSEVRNHCILWLRGLLSWPCSQALRHMPHITCQRQNTPTVCSGGEKARSIVPSPRRALREHLELSGGRSKPLDELPLVDDDEHRLIWPASIGGLRDRLGLLSWLHEPWGNFLSYHRRLGRCHFTKIYYFIHFVCAISCT